jgi:Ca2+-transporting ATPase
MIAFVWELMGGSSLERARTVTLTAVIIFELFFAFNCRSERKSIVEYNPFGNRYLVITIILTILLQVAIIYVPFFQPLFGTVPITLGDWGKIMFLGSLALVVSPKFFLKRE